MPVLQLTKRNIDKIPFADQGQVDYFDTELKGFSLRVGKDSKTFFVKVDVLDPAKGKYKTVRGKVGRYGELTPDEARKKAPEIMQRLRTGKPVNDDTIPTLRGLYERYIKDKPLAKTTLMAYEFNIPPKFGSWLDLPLPKLATMLTPDVVIERYQQIMASCGNGAVHNAFKCLQSVVNYGMVLYPQHLPGNPVKVISDAKLWTERKAREDCLDPEQFPTFYEGLLQFTPIHRDCFLFALYQGLRPNEAQSIRWDDIDLHKKTAYIRHETETSKRSYSIPLCRQTVEIIKRRHEVKEEGNPFAFPSDWRTNKRGHITMRAEKLKQRTGLDLTVHGLRRSFITTGERLRLRREDINLLTGHMDNSVTGKHYTKLTIDDLRPTLKRIADEIEQLLTRQTAKIINLPTAQGE